LQCPDFAPERSFPFFNVILAFLGEIVDTVKTGGAGLKKTGDLTVT
jgi:hypothetical protein